MLTSFIILILAVSAIVAAPSLQRAFAQEISITTSADDNGGIFFGEGVLRVVVTDPDADDDSTVEDITVDIDADPDSGSQGSLSVTVPETSDSSGRFEFYLAHDSAIAVGPEDLDPVNTEGVEGDGDCTSECAPFVTFGPSGDLQVDADLYEDMTFDLTVGDAEIRIEYEEDLSEVELDRSAYGSDSFVYVFIIDQDANLNPSEADEFIVDPDSTPNSDLLELGGGSIEGVVTFRETSDNSARFEGRYELGASITFESESLVLTLFDKSNYAATLAADENDSDSTDEVSFTIGDTDGTIDVGGGGTVDEPTTNTYDAVLSSSKASYALGENITITIEDPDANANSGAVEDIDVQLSAPNGSSAIISATESDQNTGVFGATFPLGSDGTVAGTQLKIDAGQQIVITYVDERPADYAERIDSGQDPEEEFTLEIGTRQQGATGVPSAYLTSPAVMDIEGAAGPHPVGSQLRLSTTIENNGTDVQPYVVLIEVRDSDGITVFLAWQSGSLEVDGTSTLEVSWTPEATGEYEVRAFALSSLSEGNVISDVSSGRASIVSS